MEFPLLTYRCPGPFAGPLGKTYDTLCVADTAEFDAALAAGWLPSLQDAAETAAGLRAAPVEAEAPVDDNAPPTRDEMLEQAKKIGLKVDRRWSDETLLDNIVARMREQEQGQ